jgi:hypothetical protein
VPESTVFAGEEYKNGSSQIPGAMVLDASLLRFGDAVACFDFGAGRLLGWAVVLGCRAVAGGGGATVAAH